MPDKRKQRFARQAVAVAQEADAFYVSLSALMGDLFANGYNSTGSAAFTDGDFVDSGLDDMTAAKLNGLFVAFENLKNSFDNGGTITLVRTCKHDFTYE